MRVESHGMAKFSTILSIDLGKMFPISVPVRASMHPVCNGRAPMTPHEIIQLHHFAPSGTLLFVLLNLEIGRPRICPIRNLRTSFPGDKHIFSKIRVSESKVGPRQTVVYEECRLQT